MCRSLPSQANLDVAAAKTKAATAVVVAAMEVAAAKQAETDAKAAKAAVDTADKSSNAEEAKAAVERQAMLGLLALILLGLAGALASLEHSVRRQSALVVGVEAAVVLADGAAAADEANAGRLVFARAAAPRLLHALRDSLTNFTAPADFATLERQAEYCHFAEAATKHHRQAFHAAVTAVVALPQRRRARARARTRAQTRARARARALPKTSQTPRLLLSARMPRCRK